MAGMGPPPKHPDQRRRRNATTGITQLPMEGYQGPIPDWPLTEPSPAELARWEKLWRSPQAAMWVRMYIDDAVARYVRNCLLVENDSHTTVALAHLHSEIRQLEDRLGLSPLALLRLRWEIVPDEVAEKKEEKSSAKRRLRAVDPDAASG